MDWKALIVDLEAAGLTQKEIAGQVGCSQPYVSQLKKGVRKNPDFGVGRALVDLHRRLPKARKRTEARAA